MKSLQEHLTESEKSPKKKSIGDKLKALKDRRGDRKKITLNYLYQTREFFGKISEEDGERFIKELGFKYNEHEKDYRIESRPGFPKFLISKGKTTLVAYENTKDEAIKLFDKIGVELKFNDK